MTSLLTSQGGSDSQTPAKKRCLGASDRLALDVGGIKFVSAASTLTSNSSYFSSLLSENWNGANQNQEIFLDQDPTAFAKLLAYMRRGLIKVEEIDTDVLSLAEFLGVERLLVAVKVRSYQNLGFDPGLSGKDEGTIAAAFDEQHGGIIRALSAGILPRSLVHEENVKKEFAILKFLHRGFDDIIVELEPQQTERPDLEFDGLITNALNRLYQNGYTEHETQMDTYNRHDTTWTFSRRQRHSVCSNHNEIFIPTNLDMIERKEQKWNKQFALLLEEKDHMRKVIHAPSEFHEDPQQRDGPLAVAIVEIGINDEGSWLERHGFVSREESLERLFEDPLDDLLRSTFREAEETKYMSYRLYSRKVACSARDN